MRRVTQVAYIFFTDNKQYHSFFCNFSATPTKCTWNLQKSRKKLT